MRKRWTKGLAGLLFALAALWAIPVCAQDPKPVSQYVEVIKKQGREPVDFINTALAEHDLVVFDDALHNALEPFQFYNQLLRDKTFTQKVKYIFVEVLSIASQPHIDRYLESPVKDSSLLLEVFQNDFSGYGWRYQTYLDLLARVWELNRSLPEAERVKLIGVDQPVYWEAMHSRQDYDIFQQSLTGRDYFMYRIITEKLNNFSEGKKAVFLTNTRHAYKGIKNSKGVYYWNTTTFLQQHHPGKIYSVRFHNATLFIEKQKETGAAKTTEGLDRVSYRWVRMENGRWDQAFALNGNKPVAIPLAGNVFGAAPYAGNHMLDVQKGQSMQDAYDALIFLAPLNQLHFSARVGFIYTPAFKAELKRRIMILTDNNPGGLLKRESVNTLEEYIEKTARYVPVTKNTYLEE